MQSWGEMVMMAECYQEDMERIERKLAGKGDPCVEKQPAAAKVIRLIKHLTVKSKAAAM